MSDFPYVGDERIRATPEQLEAWNLTTSGAGVQASGPCLRCGHPTSTDITSDVVSPLASGEASVLPEERTTRRFGCICEMPHPGRPDTVKVGCGRWWLASMVSRNGGTKELIAPPDETLAPAANALDAAARY